MMRSLRASCLLALLAAASFPALAAPVNEPVFRSGHWFVVRSTKPDGAVACTGFYRAHREIQLSQDALIIKVPGKIDRVAIGYDGRAPATRSLDAVEQEMGAIVFRGADFDRLRGSKKLTLEVVAPEGKPKRDLPIEGLSGALANIAAGCPEPAEKPAVGAAQGEAIGRCPARLVARMRTNGAPEEKIAARCR